MKDMINKVLDSIFPVLFGAGGGVFGVRVNPICVIPITIEEIAGTIVSALIFATIGGVLGWAINRGLNACFKNKKTNK